MLKIVGEKIILRSVQKEDIQTLWKLRYGEEDPEFKKWDAPYFPLVRVEYEDFYNRMIGQLESGYDSEMIIEVDGKIIGTVVYYWEHEPSRWMEVGIIIYLPDYWNGGYGTEAIKLWVTHLFKQFPILVRLGYTTWSGNHRMVSVGKKLGMIEEARIRKARIVNDEYYDSVKLGVLREEWQTLHGERVGRIVTL
ncbi:GNAT family N-acetyltransferase [Sutcliffiella cohnii]|uniref:GNAT family N-acetyltransferase n=1 Tax=Sutcliffiella cohnii TaxID=33932 RepID=A0A223KM59_9BACI|nr:GNAT family protein [Sutcliffiella cohnii]AST90448.1 GNAT family N-acetyltransferase [Sutcliffiella cohnii]